MSGNRKTMGMVPDAAENTQRKNLSAYKAVSVKQPYASMIAGLVFGHEKTIETRTWSTTYRGDLVIVSSKQPSSPSVKWPVGEYPTGVALCIVNLIACRPMTWHDCEKARCDLYDGAYAWVLRDIRQIVPPQKVHGQLRIYTCVIRT